MICDSCRQADDWATLALQLGHVAGVCERQARHAHELCERGDCDCACR
jgi:hypothetical protein